MLAARAAFPDVIDNGANSQYWNHNVKEVSHNDNPL
jgi:hypothetical protein